MSVKYLDLHIKSFDDIESEEGVFTAYANVKNVVDKARECSVDGCFIGSVTKAQETNRYPKMLLQHDHKQVCGIWVNMEEDEHGLKVTGKLALNTTIGRETYELLKMGALDSLSIGYIVKREHYDAKTNITFLQEVELKEISIVTFPCNIDSLVESVKSEDIERILTEEPTIEEDDSVVVSEEQEPEEEVIPDEVMEKLDSLVLSIKLDALIK